MTIYELLPARVRASMERHAWGRYANSLDIRLWDGDGNFVDVLQWGNPWWHVVSYVHPTTKKFHLINVWGPNGSQRARDMAKKILGR